MILAASDWQMPLDRDNCGQLRVEDDDCILEMSVRPPR
jgi:hypothetical protein